MLYPGQFIGWVDSAWEGRSWVARTTSVGVQLLESWRTKEVDADPPPTGAELTPQVP